MTGYWNRHGDAGPLYDRMLCDVGVGRGDRNSRGVCCWGVEIGFVQFILGAGLFRTGRGENRPHDSRCYWLPVTPGFIYLSLTIHEVEVTEISYLKTNKLEQRKAFCFLYYCKILFQFDLSAALGRLFLRSQCSQGTNSSFRRYF